MIRFVATLPPATVDAQALAFAARARALGASLLEVRTDLTPLDVDLGGLAKVLPLLVSERGHAVPDHWRSVSEFFDRDILVSSKEGATLCSIHTATPLEPAQAEALWANAEILPHQQVKHVEPLGPPATGDRLFETQSRLKARFGNRVTVLAMGPLALPHRALLSTGNAFEYCALDASFAAAGGQRLLADAVRSSQASGRGNRLGIFGTRIAGSRSPRIHAQPFDRIDLPEDAPVGEIIAALRPHYKGFAITSPFKRPVAEATASRIPAVNTLVRTSSGWRALNTDVMGAGRALDRLLAGKRVPFTILGNGGVTDALKVAAQERALSYTILRRQELSETPVSGFAVWTWPPDIAPPPHLRFEHAEVAVVSYGNAGRSIAAQISKLGGRPHLLGAAWFVAQARFQRALWETAE